MRKTTQVMHAQIGKAILELRRRMDWSQEQLGMQIGKQGQPTHVNVIGRWERGAESPSPTKRCALAKLAAKHEHEDLAALFRAPIVAWRLVSLCLPKGTDERERPL